MTPKHFSDRICSYNLPKINYTKKLEKKKRNVRSPFSPSMQEHVAGCIGNVRNTRIKNIQIVYCVTKSVGHIVNPFLCREANASSSRRSFGSKRYFWRNLYIHTRSNGFGMHTYSLLTRVSYEKDTYKHTTSRRNLSNAPSFSHQLILHFEPN
jgi:hypothetical protein